MIYNTNYDISAILIALFSIICIIMRKKLRKRQNRFFLIILLLNLFSAVFDILSSITSSYPLRYSMQIRDLWNYAFLISHNLFPMMFACYVASEFGLFRQKSKYYWHAFLIPFCVNMILFLLNPFYHILFYYNSLRIYTHNPLFLLLYINAFIYAITAIVYIFRYGNRISINRKLALFAFIALSLIAVIIQLCYPHLLLELFIESLSLLAILFTIENEDELRSSITGIYNRSSFINDHTVLLATRSTYQIVILKLPDLKYYFFSMGIAFVNGVLKQIASWLEGSCINCRVYDCDNGHFVITYDDPLLTDSFINLIRNRFENKWSYNDLCITFDIALSVIKVPEDISIIEELLIAVDMPFSRSLQGGFIKETTVIRKYRKELDIEIALNKAVKSKSFQLYYQPIWSFHDNRVKSAEALLRLYDEKLGYIPPDKFIPVAERNGYIIPIGEIVFEKACRFYAENKLWEYGIEYIEVNLSVVQCMNRNLVNSFMEILSRYHLAPSRINLEITESAIANSMDVLDETIAALNKKGFSLSMDDYGTGYSNFSYMLALPFRIIKLDKSILWNACKTRHAAIILKNTVQMIHELDLEIVVEGVETSEQKEILDDLQCTYQQGFYYSMPLPEADFLQFINDCNNSVC